MSGGYLRYSLETLRQQADKADCEGDLLAFIERFWRVNDSAQPFIRGWAIEAICDHLQAVDAGQIKRLIINVPPGFSKSSSANVYFPAWQWGPRRRPHYRYITAAYTSKLTIRDNRRFRRVILDEEYQRLWGGIVSPDPSMQGVNNYGNRATGWKLATSVEGVGTGERGNVIILDDVNNPKDIESETVRESTRQWLTEVMPDRLNDLVEGAIICIQQRTHEGDASGTLIELWGSSATHLMIPMEYEPARHCITVLKRARSGRPLVVWEDPRGLDDEGYRLSGFETEWIDTALGPREVVIGVRPRSDAEGAAGILAFPARFPVAAVDEQKKVKGEYAYHGQYQQSPSPRGGGIIKAEWWRLWASRDFPPCGTIVVSLDTAIKEGEENDWNACVVVGSFAGQAGEPLSILRDAWRVRTDLAELIARVIATCRKHRADVLLIEDKTRGHDVASEIVRQVGSREWSTILLKPHGDKVARAKGVQSMFSGACRIDPATGVTRWEGGLVYAPDTQWAQLVIDEAAALPKGTHDDLADALVQAMTWMRSNGVSLMRSEYDEEELDRRRYVRPSAPRYDV